MDFAGPLSKSGSGKRYMLVAVEHLTGWLIAKPTETSTVEEVVKLIEEEIIYNFGSLGRIVSDNATCFTTPTLENLMKKHGIEWKIVLAYSPMPNGRAERMIRTLKRAARKIIIGLGSSSSTWEAAIQTAEYGYRRRASAGGSSPFQLLYGVPPRMTLLDQLPLFPTANLSYRNMELIHVAAVRAERSHARCKSAPPRKRWDVTFRVGEEILVAKDHPWDPWRNGPPSNRASTDHAQLC